MDERITKCNDMICEAFKTLIRSSHSNSDAIGLITIVLHEFPKTYEKAINEGFDEIAEKEGN